MTKKKKDAIEWKAAEDPIMRDSTQLITGQAGGLITTKEIAKKTRALSQRLDGAT